MSAAMPSEGEILPLARRLSGAGDPLAIYNRLCPGRMPHTLLLESADTTTGAGDRSIVVVRSALRLRCLERDVVIDALSANGRAMLPWLRDCLAEQVRVREVQDGIAAEYPETRGIVMDEASRIRSVSPLDALRAVALRTRVTSRPAEMNHLVAGTFSYDLVDLFEPLPAPVANPVPFPRYDFWMPELMILVDHRRNVTTVVATVVGGGGAERRYHDAVAHIGRVESELGGGNGGPTNSGSGEGEEPVVDIDDTRFADLVDELKRYLHAGDVFQIVPSRTYTTPCSDPLSAYARLRRSNPSPYMFHVSAPEYTLFGASPETSLKVTGSTGTVLMRPIAGTVRRGMRADGTIDEDLDARLEAALRTDTKEMAEHLMLVDLARNDVARVSRSGTRTVARLLAVERYSHVMHLVSEVTGVLRPDLDALHAYAASMNMGTLVGAPKVRAAQILRETESAARGPYGGAVGYLTERGELDTAIIIRSALVRDGVASVRAGAGVVIDSNPESEARETTQKASAVLAAITGREIA